MHKTQPALRSFCIIARRKRLGGCVGCIPPVMALAGLVIVGVSHLPQYQSCLVVAMALFPFL